MNWIELKWYLRQFILSVFTQRRLNDWDFFLLQNQNHSTLQNWYHHNLILNHPETFSCHIYGEIKNQFRKLLMMIKSILWDSQVVATLALVKFIFGSLFRFRTIYICKSKVIAFRKCWIKRREWNLNSIKLREKWRSNPFFPSSPFVYIFQLIQYEWSYALMWNWI
jgi:hypothetical protein